MSATAAQILANRLNAARSTGPRTEEGKAASRANSFKHGMTGGGVVMALDQAAEVARLRDAMGRELRPKTDLGAELIARIASMAVRMGRCSDHEIASVAANVRRAGLDFDEARLRQADDLIDGLAEATAPRASIRGLRATPEGVDRLISAYQDLRDDLDQPAGATWGDGHLRRMIHLSGRREGEPGSAGLMTLHRLILSGDAEARAEMRVRIDSAIEELGERRESFDFEAIAAERAASAKLALFDPSAEATRARRYEASAENGFFKALREFRRTEAEAEARPPSDRLADRRTTARPEIEAPADRPRLGSFSQADAPAPRTAVRPPIDSFGAPSMSPTGDFAPVWATPTPPEGPR